MRFAIFSPSVRKFRFCSKFYRGLNRESLSPHLRVSSRQIIFRVAYLSSVSVIEICSCQFPPTTVPTQFSPFELPKIHFRGKRFQPFEFNRMLTIFVIYSRVGTQKALPSDCRFHFRTALCKFGCAVSHENAAVSPLPNGTVYFVFVIFIYSLSSIDRSNSDEKESWSVSILMGIEARAKSILLSDKNGLSFAIMSSLFVILSAILCIHWDYTVSR